MHNVHINQFIIDYNSNAIFSKLKDLDKIQFTAYSIYGKDTKFRMWLRSQEAVYFSLNYLHIKLYKKSKFVLYTSKVVLKKN